MARERDEHDQRDFTHQRDQQAERLSRLGRSLSAEQWTSPSLCDGWEVRDVFAHLTLSCTVGMARTGLRTLRHASIDKATFVESKRFAEATLQEELLDAFDRGRANVRGPARVFPDWMVFGDLVLHELDVRRPLGTGEPIADETKVAVLGLVIKVSTPMVPAKKRTAGLSLVATDVPWSRMVDGAPTVEGPAEDLLLAVGGRAAGFPVLAGEGVDTLARRAKVDLS
jgi:uncharacterized protein (TIGR03083 family)